MDLLGLGVDNQRLIGEFLGNVLLMTTLAVLFGVAEMRSRRPLAWWVRAALFTAMTWLMGQAYIVDMGPLGVHSAQYYAVVVASYAGGWSVGAAPLLVSFLGRDPTSLADVLAMGLNGGHYVFACLAHFLWWRGREIPRAGRSVLLDFVPIAVWIGVSSALLPLSEPLSPLVFIGIPIAAIGLWMAAAAFSLSQRIVSAALRRDQALDDRNRFLRALRHQVRTPLTQVAGAVDALADPNALSENERGELALVAKDGVFGLAQLVDDLEVFVALTAEDLPESRPQRVAVADLAEELGREYRWPTRVEGEVEALIDPGRLRHVLTGVITSAIGEGGEATVKLREEGGMAVVDVCHPGDGNLSWEEGFRPFDDEAINHHDPNSGLSLWVAAALVGEAGGTIEYVTKSGDGCSGFTLALPLG